MSAELLELSVQALAARLQAAEVSSEEVTRAVLERIDQTRVLSAYLHVDSDGALQQAQAADARRSGGHRLGPLDGVPVAIKDALLTADQPTTCGSRMLETFVAPYDATAVRLLREAGAVILGKLNMDEFAMGSSNEHSAFGPTRNPWNTEHVPGGSSGGSAAAVAARAAFGALGSDTGGSIRQPAAHTGIVGLKPTYGRVSRYGLVAFGSSLDQVGPMTRTVADAALMLQAIAQPDPYDATSAERPVPDYVGALEGGVEGLRIGWPKEYFLAGIDPEVQRAVEQAAAAYERLGATIVEVSLPHSDYAIATYYIICTAEASSNLARYDGVRYGLRRDPGAGLGAMYEATREAGFGEEVKRRVVLGTYVLSAGYYDAYYRRAQKVRTLLRRDFARAFESVDVLLTPTTPSPAFRLGERIDDPLQMYLADVFTVGANLAGLPGLSLPCGFSASGLPLGAQLLAPPWQEETLLRVGRAYEREHDWSTRRPPA